MSEQSFAPGPYTYKAVVGLPDEDWWSILADGGKREIAILPRIDADSEANARLLAAAPDLYAACKLMQKSLNGSPSDFVGMLAAHRQLDVALALAEEGKRSDGSS